MGHRTQKPKHIIIQESIKEKIQNGEWPPGSRLPSQRALAAAFKVNRSTIIAALDELKAQGVVEGKVGSSTKVVLNAWQSMAASTPAWNEQVRWSIHPSNDLLVQKINQAETEHSFLPLSKGEMGSEFHPANALGEVFKKAGNQIGYFGYGDGRGNYSLRKAVSDYLASRGITAGPDSILIVSGSLQALQLISLGVLQPDSTVFLEQPSYLYSLPVFRSAGMHLQGIEMDESGLQTKLLEEQPWRKNKSILYTNPTFHNPTGTTMTLGRRKALLCTCNEFHLPVIEDDIYHDLWLETPPPPALKALDTQGHVLHIGSFSKTVDPGLRIGWMTGPEDVVKRLADIRMQMDYGTSAVSQVIAEHLLTSGLYEEHMHQIRHKLLQKRNYLLDLLHQNFKEEAYWEIPEGGFFIYVHFYSIESKKLFAAAFKQGVLINPGSIYHDEKSTSVRFSFAYPSCAQMENGIKIIKDIINHLKETRMKG
ncbi:PLP-dependent aminotransferase family protein [Alteribacillus bidgolensis]|uniref:Transcriptional regulator, GntR family n=1 Tax=Alteribacillus bidgolensis TaxID=930129 RepID=A0A1G8Q162_9BACI|nr:PLP-dependent aminotransferase family protein [Alteribacillus bidgolensis]SDI98256.1 transcriptional regulator, GntR family [Alteribacillus bidgolensis]